MCDSASGAANPRAFDPSQANHYAASEETQLELRMLFAAMSTIAQLIDTQPDQIGPDIDVGQLAPILFTLGRHGERLLEDMPVQFPAANKRKSA